MATPDAFLGWGTFFFSRGRKGGWKAEEGSSLYCRMGGVGCFAGRYKKETKRKKVSQDSLTVYCTVQYFLGAREDGMSHTLFNTTRR